MKKLSLFLAVLLICMSAFVGCAKTKEGKNPVSVDIKGENAVEMSASGAFESALNKEIEYIENFDFENFTCSYDITLDAGEGLWELIEDLSGQAGVADIMNEVGLDNIAICFDFMRNKNLFDISADALVNGTSIVDADVVFDADSKDGCLTIPALNEKAIGMNFAEVIDALSEEVDFSKAIDAYMDYYYAVLDFYKKHNEKELTGIVLSYLNTAKESIGEPSSSGTTEVNFGSFTKSLETDFYKIDQKDAFSVVLSLAKKLRNDDQVKALAGDFYGLFGTMNKYTEALGGVALYDESDFDETYDALMAELDNAISELEGEIASVEADEELDFIIYYDNGKFCGIELSGEDELSSVNFTCAYAEEGENIGFIFAGENVYSDGFEDASAVYFYGTKKDNVVDGIIAISADNYVYEIAVEDFVVNADGTGKGTVTIYGDTLYEFSAGEIPGNVGFRVVVDQPDLSTSSVDLQLLNFSDVVLTLGIDVGLEEGSENITLPESYVDANSEEAQAWAQELVSNIPSLLNKLTEAGISQDILGLVLNM